VQKNPIVTQKEIAMEIGKSERTIKTITVNLQKKRDSEKTEWKKKWILDYC